MPEKKENESTVMDKVGGVGRAAAATIAGAKFFFPLTAAAGLYGIGKGASAAIQGKNPLTAAAAGVEQVSSLPNKLLTTPESQKYAEAVHKVIGVINWPIEESVKGYKGLTELATTGDIQKAADVVEDKSEGSSYLIPAIGSVAEANALMAMFGRPGFRHTKLEGPEGPKRLVPFAEHGAMVKGVQAAAKYAPIGYTAVKKRLSNEKGGFVAGSKIRADLLPAGWKMEVGRTTTKEGHTYEGEIDYPGKRVVFADKKYMNDPIYANHEIAHIVLHTLPEHEYVKLPKDYAKLMKLDEWEVKNKFHHERLAMDYGNYLNNPKSVDPKLRKFFDERLPKAEGFENKPGEPGFVERRKAINELHRKRVDKMNMEERKTALLTDRLTGIRNERAYEEAERMPYQASIDVDGLGVTNNTYGHDAGNALLRKVGKALEIASDKNTRAYHFHGDEFALEGVSPGHIHTLIRKARQILKNEPIDVTNMHTGEPGSFVADFSYGVAKDMKSADTAMYRNKIARKATRGEAPVSDSPEALALQVENVFREDPKGDAGKLREWIQSHDPAVVDQAADLLMMRGMSGAMSPKESMPVIAHARWLKQQVGPSRIKKTVAEDPHNQAIEAAMNSPELADMKAATEVPGAKKPKEAVPEETVPPETPPRSFEEQAAQAGVKYEGVREMPDGETKAMFRDPETGRLFSMSTDKTLTPEMVAQAKEALSVKTQTGGKPPGGEPPPPGKPPGGAPPGGEPPGRPPGGEPPGKPPTETRKRPLEKLTDALEDVDTRKDPFSPIREIRRDMSQAIRRTINEFEGVKAEAAKIWKKFVEEPVVTAYDKIVGNYELGKEIAGWEARKWAEEIQKKVPKSLQEAVTNYIEARGDTALLLERANESKNMQLKKGYQKAANLPKDIRDLADQVTGFFDEWLGRLQDAGVLGDQFIQNYVNHVWDRNPKMAAKIQAEIDFGELKTNPSLARKRIIESYFEGEQLGLLPKNKGIGFLAAAYNKMAAEALYARRAVEALFKAKAEDGEPILVPDPARSKVIDKKEYRVVDPAGPENANGEIRAMRVFDTEKEAVDFMAGSDIPDLMMVPKTRQKVIVSPSRGFTDKTAKDGRSYRPAPQHAAIQSLVWSGSDSAGNPIMYRGPALVHPAHYRNLKNWLGTSRIRQSKPGRMALDVSAFAKQTMLSISVFHPVQLGVHGIGHHVNLARLVDIDLKSLEQRNAVRSGLVLGFESGLQRLSEGVYGGGLMDRLPIAGSFFRKLGDWTFQSYLPRLKMTMYLHALERNKARYEGKLTLDQIRTKTASQANSAFGGLNYRKMGRNKTLQDFYRLMTLAPDFLEARMRFAGESMRLIKHKEQAVAMARLAAYMFVTARVMNYFLDDGNLHWERPFGVVYKGQEFALRSVPGDIIHLVVDPRSFIYHRLNPTIARTLVEALTGRDQYGKERGMTSQMRDFFVTHIPIPLQGPFRTGDQKLWESAMSSTGVSTYKYKTPAEREMSKLISLNVPSKELTREESRFVKAKAKLKEAIREGTKLDPDVVKELRQLSPMQAKKLYRDSTRYTRFQEGFKRLNIREGLKVFQETRSWFGLNIDNDRQRYMAASELVRKFRNAVKNNPHQLRILTDNEKTLLKEAFDFLNEMNSRRSN